jgi:DNA-binding LacI/PurR family transcriptional regulator
LSTAEHESRPPTGGLLAVPHSRLVSSRWQSHSFAEVILAIEGRLGAEAFMTLVGHTAEDPEKEERLLKKMHEFPPNGVLICPVRGSAL